MYCKESTPSLIISSGHWASLGTYDSTFLRFLRLRGIPSEFSSDVKNKGFLRFLELRRFLLFLDPPHPNIGPLATFETYDPTFLPFLRLRGILCEFSSNVEKNAFLRFLHLRRILRFLDPPPNSGRWASLGIIDTIFLRFLRLREIIRKF